MKKKKIIIVIIILVLLMIAGASIYFGIRFNKLSKPSNIIGLSIDEIDSKIVNYIKIDDKYNLGDTFNIESTLDLELDSEDYLKRSKKEKEYAEKYKTLKNLSETTNTINIKQNKKDKKSLLEINSTLKKDKLVDYKYLIENSTSYYYLDDALKKYVNNGTSNYYEMFNDEYTTLDNIQYVHSAFITALKNNLKDEYFKRYQVTENINGSNVDVNQTVLRINDKLLHKIFNGTINDLRSDERANKILSSAYKDFDKYKIKDSKILLEKQETYTINIYSSKYLNNVLKYELVHLKGDEKKTYSYEGNTSSGTLYYIEDDTVIYSIKVTNDDKILECKINDSTGTEIGIFKLEKNDAGTYYTFNFDDGTNKYDVIYSSKYTDVKDNKSFTNEKDLSFKKVENKVGILSGSIKLNINVNKDVNIDEDVSNAVLVSTLSDAEKEKYDSKIDRIKERLKK